MRIRLLIIIIMSDLLNQTPLGKKSSYISQYQPDLLCPITREKKRQEIGIDTILPFYGVDIWRAYEISWLNPKGKPVVVIGEFVFPCESPNLIESKSFKLYLNSFNNTSIDSVQTAANMMTCDLSQAALAPVQVTLYPLDQAPSNLAAHFVGTNLDLLDITCDVYTTTPNLLTVESQVVSETLCSDLHKSNCLVTGQPDWGSVQIDYTGNKINHENLLRYLVSFRNHNEFHEQCVERIFFDVMTRCKPTLLTVFACYTRRGGLDINPYRSTNHHAPKIINRLKRQ